MGLFNRIKRYTPEEVANILFVFYDEVYRSFGERADKSLYKCAKEAQLEDTITTQDVNSYIREMGFVFLFLTLLNMVRWFPSSFKSIKVSFLEIVRDKGYGHYLKNYTLQEYGKIWDEALLNKEDTYKKLSYAANRNCFGTISTLGLAGILCIHTDCLSYEIALKDYLKDLKLI